MATVTFSGIGRRYGQVVAVRDANLSINDGEFVAFVGPSGCGKTTLLNMVAGLLEPSEGEIRIDGLVVNGVDPKDRDIAMVFQNYALYPLKDVYGNLAFPLRMRKLPPAEIDTRVRDAAEKLGLTTLLQRKPRELSGGQQQRVALGRAIVRHPKVFLMDEPLSNLDAKLRVQMRAQIKRLQRSLGVTVIYVTHDQVEAMTMSDRIVVMNQGEVQQMGSPQEVFRNPVNQFVAAFIGSPAINLFAALLETQGGTPVLRVGDNLLPLPAWARPKIASGPVMAGFRPSSITVYPDEQPGTVPCELFEIEPTGDETFVHFTLRGSLLIARLEQFPELPSGAPVWVSFAPDGLHLFDPQSGASLLDRTAAPA